MKTDVAGSGVLLRRALWFVAVIAAAAGSLVGAMWLSASDGSTGIGDPGALVRWGLPASTVVHHVSLSVVLASLVFMAVILPTKATAPGPREARTSPAIRHRVAAVGSLAAVAWVLSAVSVLVLNYADVLGQPVSADAGFVRQFGYYVIDTETGRTRGAVVLLAIAVAMVLFSRPGRHGILLAGWLTSAAVVPLAMVGHAMSGEVRWVAVASLGLHILGVCVWVGGVALLGLLAGLLLTDNPSSAAVTVAVFRRFSALAGVAFTVVFGSGIINSLIRLGDIAALNTPYGTLILLKTAATLGLGLIGYFHRRWIVAASLAGRVPRAPGWRLIGAEILIMGGTMAIAVALARTTPPVHPGSDMVMGAALVLNGLVGAG